MRAKKCRACGQGQQFANATAKKTDVRGKRAQPYLWGTKGEQDTARLTGPSPMADEPRFLSVGSTRQRGGGGGRRRRTRQRVTGARSDIVENAATSSLRAPPARKGERGPGLGTMEHMTYAACREPGPGNRKLSDECPGSGSNVLAVTGVRVLQQIARRNKRCALCRAVTMGRHEVFSLLRHGSPR